MTKTLIFAVLMAVFLGSGVASAQESGGGPAGVMPQETAAEAQAPVSPKTEALQAVQDVVQQARESVAAAPTLTEPARPSIIQAAAERGAKIQYLGERNGFTGWAIMEGEAPAFLYVSGDEQTIFRGLMFDDKGQAVTIGQVNEAQLRNPEFFGLTAQDVAQAQESVAGPNPTPVDTRKPDQVLYDSLAVANYVTLGSTAATAPVLYTFIDPDCPYCKKFLKDIDKDYIQSGKVQLRVIPIGILGESSKQRAAYLLSQKQNGGTVLMQHVRGEKVMPAQAGIALDDQQLNLDLFQLWRFDGTPLFLFKDKNGTVMMVRGEPKDIKVFFDQIAPERGAP